LDTFGSDSIFVKNVFTWGKSSAAMYSLCMGDNHGTVLESTITMLAHTWFDAYASELVPILYSAIKTWVQMFYF